MFGGDVVGYYHNVPFAHRNAFVNVFRGLPSVDSLNRCLLCLGAMNGHVDTLEIMDAAKTYLSGKYFNVFSVSEKHMIDKIDEGKYVSDDAFFVEKKYEWIKWLDKSDVMKIVQENGCDIKKKKMVDKIRIGIEALKQDGGFISAADIAEVIDENYEKVRRYSELFKEEIDAYNVAMFNTAKYSEFSKNENTENIKRVVSELGITNKRKIASLIGVHYNTVGNLWEEAFK